MRWTRSTLVFSLGLFALVAQTLLFRDFLTAFEGNELGVGSFFGSWLIWVAIGALLGRIRSLKLRYGVFAGLLAGRVSRPDWQEPGKDGPGDPSYANAQLRGIRSAAATRFGSRFELLTLSYIPAFLLQLECVAHARWLGGVSAYEVYPFGRMFCVAMAVNAPVSCVTGFLFTRACSWWSQSERLPVARVYIWETLGSFAGGVIVTGLLAVGASTETTFLIVAGVLASAVGLTELARLVNERSAPDAAPAVPRNGESERSDRPPRGGLRGRAGNRLGFAVGFTLALAALLALLGGWSHRWTEHRQRTAWSRLLPAAAYSGSFATAQAQYLYGEREGQWLVMSWGGVSESLPETEHASEIVALCLAQHPRAKRVLVVGPNSLSVCHRFRALPTISRVVWLHPDAEYPARLLAILPPPYREAAARIEIPASDVRALIARNAAEFDLVVLNLPDATTLVLNRYVTEDFFRLLKGALAPDGIVCLRLSGGANYLGGELAYLGASALHTLEAVFPRVVLKPGDESWLIATAGAALSPRPAELRDRFAAIDGAADVYPPDGLLSLYLPDRAEFQLAHYRDTITQSPAGMLRNTDRRPKALLFSLVFALRRAEWLSLAGVLPVLLVGGLGLSASPIAVYGLLRLLYLRAPRGGSVTAGEEPPSVFDSGFLILSTGLAGMSLSIALMFLYQSRFGSLFLHVGLVSSLFMLGSSLGGMAVRRILLAGRFRPRVVLAGCLAAHLAIVVLIAVLPSDAPRVVYGLLFSACGFFVGAYFPIAADRLLAAGRSDAGSGALLEMLDNLGGAAGALVTGWILLPVLGSMGTSIVLLVLVAVNAVPLGLPARRPAREESADPFDRWQRPLGYGLAGIGMWALIASQIAAVVRPDDSRQRLLAAARAMAPEGEFREDRVEGEGGRSTEFVRTADGGYIFRTGPFVTDVYGYGGPVELAVFVDARGTVRDLRILRSHETPDYVQRLHEGWLAQLPGKNLFEPRPFAGVDAVSGATMTCEAVLRSLEQAGPRFAAAALGSAAPRETSHGRMAWPDRGFFFLVAILTLAALGRRWPGAWRRRAFLAASLLLAGVCWNLQYSSQHVLALLSFRTSGNWLSSSFLLVLGVPVVVFLFGNLYCGYACPFGALQELIGDLRPKRWATDPDKNVWRYGRAVKYGLLLLVVLLFAVTRDYAVLSVDPLVTFFSSGWAAGTSLLALVALGASFFFRRFWCRNLCPAGAFLALLCGVKPLRGLTPRVGPGRCDLGVRRPSDLDCLCCDRCRHA